MAKIKRRLENIRYNEPRLTVSPQNIRFGYYNEDRAKKLAQEIWLAGAILQPISISEGKDEKQLEILDGQHRHKALLILKDRYGEEMLKQKDLDTIPAIIYSDLDETYKLNICQRIANNPPLKPSYGLMIESYAQISF
jgi:ParB-like chromosome segregation protein Spo0J